MNRAKSADDYIRNAQFWQSELKTLRQVLLKTPLTEEIKWGAPCYTYTGKNVVGLGGFKSYFGLWFYQGVFLIDKDKVLINAQEGKTKALRQWRMTSAADIRKSVIRRYVREAIGLVERGQELQAVRNRDVDVPRELAAAMRRSKGTTAAFRELQKGLQREYAEHIASAKRPETRQRRIEKILPMISAGVGLNDKYRR